MKYYHLDTERIDQAVRSLEAISMVSSRFSKHSPINLASLLSSMSLERLEEVETWCLEVIHNFLSDENYEIPSLQKKFLELNFYVKTPSSRLIRNPEIFTNLLMLACRIDKIPADEIVKIADEFIPHYYVEVINWCTSVISSRFGWCQRNGRIWEKPDSVFTWEQKVESSHGD